MFGGMAAMGGNMKKTLLAACAGALAATAAFTVPASADDHAIGACLITKTDTNPFFVKMREGATAKAEELGFTWRHTDGKPYWDETAAYAFSLAEIEDEALRERVFGKIVDEHARTVRMFAAVTGHDDLLWDNAALKRSVFNRFPYLEPLNHLQVELLRRYRAGDDDPQLKRGILLTMNGLATALRNSG